MSRKSWSRPPEKAAVASLQREGCLMIPRRISLVAALRADGGYEGVGTLESGAGRDHPREL
eukprot:8120399-Alexandrium_andersonii.AAC.1